VESGIFNFCHIPIPFHLRGVYIYPLSGISGMGGIKIEKIKTNTLYIA
jgi:hypothetical protein